jgi:hypothetical protein
MEDDKESSAFEGESDSERRRRRRRRRKSKKKKEGMSAETAQLLRLARYGVGGLVMLATWGYGLYVIDKLGWGALIFFPAGIVGGLCIAAALSIPFITFVVVVVACLWRSDSGLWGALRYGGMAFVAVGAGYAVWRLFVFLIVKREVTRNEAGYK